LGKKGLKRSWKMEDQEGRDESVASKTLKIKRGQKGGHLRERERGRILSSFEKKLEYGERGLVAVTG